MNLQIGKIAGDDAISVSRPMVAIGLCCLVLICAMWTFTVVHSRAERKGVVDHAFIQNSNLAIAFEEHTNKVLKSADLTLRLVAQEYARRGAQLDIQNMIDSGLVDMDVLSFVGVMDGRAKLVLGSPEFKPIDVADREYYQFHRDHDTSEMHIGKPMLGRVRNKWVVPLSRRINRADGSFAGIAYASLDAAYFNRLFEQTNLGEQGLAMLVGLDGISRARRSGNATSTGQDMRGSSLITHHMKQPVGDFLSSGRLEGVQRLISYRTLPQYPLIIAVGTSQAEMLNRFHEERRNDYTLAGIASLLILLCGSGLIYFLAWQKRGMEALYSSNARFGVAFNQAAVGVVMTELEGRFVEVNAAFCRMLGYASEELLRRRFLDITHPDDRRTSAENANRMLEQRGESPLLEKRYLRKDGSTLWVAISVSVVRDSDGRPHNFMAIVEDISERKRAELVLADSERKFRALTEHGSDLTVVTNRDGFITYVSPSVMRLAGYAPADTLGRNFMEFVHPEEVSASRDALNELLREPGAPRTVQRRFLHRDGHWITLEVVAKNALDDPNVNGIVVNARDVTAHNRAREELEFKNTVLATQHESSPDGILLVDENARILSYNQRFVDIWRIPQELITATDDAPVLQFALSQVADPQAFRARVDYLYAHRLKKADDEIGLKDGRLLTRHSAPVVADDGKYYGRVWYFRDVTESRRSERALLRVNRALKAISACNNILIRAANETTLIQKMCDNIVEVGGYILAWVGAVENDAQKTVRPVAYAGYKEGYMENAQISWADDELGSGPIGIAIRSQKIQVVQNAETDPAFQPWRANAAKLGYGSLAAFPLISVDNVIGVLTIYAAGTDAFDEAEIRMLGELADDLAFGIVTLRTRLAHDEGESKLMRSMEGTILAMAATLEMRDAYTAGHQRRVAQLAAAIAREMGLPEDDIHGLHLAAVIHDIGKIQVPAEILSKPTRLSKLEYELIKTHAQAGYDILRDVEFSWPIAQLVYQHHERLDGTGYPRGLKGNEILLGARILGVADTVEAMASHRPYRAGLGIDRALEEIVRNSGTIYDAAVVDACVTLFRDGRFSFQV